MSSTILLYYLYNEIPDPNSTISEHISICTSLNLTGKIKISHEGINGTISGSTENTNEYKIWMSTHLLFSKCDMSKQSIGIGIGLDFDSLSIKLSNEIIPLDYPDVDME